MAAFKYLGRILTATDDNWPPVVANLSMHIKTWVRMSRIIGREGANARTSGNFFKALVQSVLLFLLEIWLVTPPRRQYAGGIPHRQKIYVGYNPCLNSVI